MMKKIIQLGLILWVIFSSFSAFSSAKLEMITDKLQFPVNFAFPKQHGGKTYIVEHQTGKIRILEGRTLSDKIFLNIKDKLTENIEGKSYELGFSGLAFSPTYEQDRYIYISYVDARNDIIVSRFTVNKVFQAADHKTEKIIMRIKRTSDTHYHSCGHITFGPKDGYLYVCVGDTEDPWSPSQFSSQKLDILPGKILRIDVSKSNKINPYAIPVDNPFRSHKKAKPEIWIYGMRNPWKFSFDHETGDLYIPDVADLTVDELNFVPSVSGGGENLGWPIYEGNVPNRTDYLEKHENITVHGPIFTYPHMESFCSIIGGQVYRGTKYPKWRGVYVFADMCSGIVWGMRQKRDKFEIKELLKSAPQKSNEGSNPTCIGEFSNLEIAVSTINGGIYQFHFPKYIKSGWHDSKDMYKELKYKNILEKLGAAKIKHLPLYETRRWKIVTFIGDIYYKIRNIF